MASPRIVPARKPTADSDPLAYANRPMERGFNEYQALHEHIVKLNAGVKGRVE